MKPRGRPLVWCFAAVALLATACVADDDVLEPSASVGGDEMGGNELGGNEAERIEASAVAIAAHPNGGFYWAELSGVVRSDDGSVVADIEVDTEGQRGLLGLAVADDGGVFVGYVGLDVRLTVAELDPDAGKRIVWQGPETVQGGNGGRILFDQTGRLLVGVGLLNDRSAQADPDDVTGKLVAIDPNGTPGQTPEILSGPWNNPFAIARTSSGDVWVADNEPRDGDERLALGNDGMGPEVAAVLPADSAPTGMTAVQISDGSEELWVCTYNTRLLLRYARSGNGWSPIGTAATDCLLDVETLADGRVAYSTGDEIVVLDVGQGR